jgi:hypothetical protein
MWPRTVELGKPLRIDFEVREGLDDPLSSLYVDLELDGVDGWWYEGPNLATIRTVSIVPKRVGRYRLSIAATSKAGCFDRTGVNRLVVVTGSQGG